jgi:hypothetical protein
MNSNHHTLNTQLACTQNKNHRINSGSIYEAKTFLWEPDKTKVNHHTGSYVLENSVFLLLHCVSKRMRQNTLGMSLAPTCRYLYTLRLHLKRRPGSVHRSGSKQRFSLTYILVVYIYIMSAGWERWEPTNTTARFVHFWRLFFCCRMH